MINFNALFEIEKVNEEQKTIDTFVVTSPHLDSKEQGSKIEIAVYKTPMGVPLSEDNINQILTIKYNKPDEDIKITSTYFPAQNMSAPFELIPMINYSFLLDSSGKLSSTGKGSLNEQSGAQLAAKILEQIRPEYVERVSQRICPDMGFEKVAERIIKAGNPFFEFDFSQIKEWKLDNNFYNMFSPTPYICMPTNTHTFF